MIKADLLLKSLFTIHSPDTRHPDSILMSLHIIIDGYNLIRQSNSLSMLDLEDIQLGREALIEQLASYKKVKPHKITVVFDGTHAPSFSLQRDRIKGIRVVFSRRGEIADTVIKEMTAKEKQKALVVSSDRSIVDYAASQGAATISSPEFEDKMTMSLLMDYRGIDLEEEEKKAWIPTTKKKGPSRRRSKKDRRNRKKTVKL